MAEAILELKDNSSLRETIAEEGFKTFMEKCDTAAIGREMEEIFSKCSG